MKWIIRYILATTVLHNLFIKHVINKDWIIPEDSNEEMNMQ